MTKLLNESSLLQVEGLTTAVRTLRGIAYPVNDVSLHVDAGEMVGLVGESGSGKSLTARSILGLLPKPEANTVAGSVLLNGRDLLPLNDAMMSKVLGREISAVFQDPATYLNPVMTIGNQIREALHSDAKAATQTLAVDDLLEKVELPRSAGVAGRFPHELSGGMKQRALIAIALAGQPDLLIADEPTTALDVTIQAQILSLLSRLRKDLNMGILLISHDLGVIAETCDRAYVMYSGRIVESGSVEDVFSYPRHPYTRGLLASAEDLWSSDRQFRHIPGRVPDLYDRPSGCAFHPRCGFAVELCKEETPVLRRIALSQDAACHLADDIPARTSSDAMTGTSFGPVEDHGQISSTGPSVRSPVSGIWTVEDLRPQELRSEGPAVGPAPLIEGRGLTKRFPLERMSFMGPRKQLRAVETVDLRIDEGESLALVGESGSGKSTIARLLIGLLRPTAGEVRFRGTPLQSIRGEDRRHFRSQVQMIFQNPYSSLNPTKSIAHILKQPYLTHNVCSSAEALERASALLQSVGLSSHHLTYFPHQLSGGERQRVAFARALALGPKIVIADEPVSALDMSVRAQVLGLMKDFRVSQGISYLLITHDLPNALALADRVAVLYLGQVVETGPTEEVFAQPKHPYTRALLAATPVADPLAARSRRKSLISGEIPSAVAPPSGCAFHPRCPFARDRCVSEAPALRAVGGATVACHFAEEVIGADLIEKAYSTHVSTASVTMDERTENDV